MSLAPVANLSPAVVGKLPPVLLTPAANLWCTLTYECFHEFSKISKWSQCSGEDDSWKKSEAKILVTLSLKELTCVDARDEWSSTSISPWKALSGCKSVNHPINNIIKKEREKERKIERESTDLVQLSVFRRSTNRLKCVAILTYISSGDGDIWI